MPVPQFTPYSGQFPVPRFAPVHSLFHDTQFLGR